MIYLQLFYIFFKVGLFGFGGGYAILPMIYQEIQTFGILSAEEFSNLVALSQVTPGPIAINAATYVGYRAAGVGGAAVATVAVSLPALILVTWITLVLQKFRNSQWINQVLKGIRPATIGLIASAFIFFGKAAFWIELPTESAQPGPIWSRIDGQAVLIFIAAWVLLRYTKAGAMWITLGGALAGLLTGMLWSIF